MSASPFTSPLTTHARRIRVALTGGLLATASLLTVGTAVTPADAAPVRAAATAATTTEFFVDAQAGSDSASGRSPQAAWRTLNKVNAATFAPGTVVRLHRGQTWRGQLTLTESGVAGKPISVRAYGDGARPVITGGGSCLNLRGNWLDVAFVHARDCDWAGFQISGDHVVVRRVTASHSVVGVHVATGAADDRVTDSSIVSNTKMSVLTKSPAYDDSGAFGVLLNGVRTEVARNTIRGHEAFSYDFGTDGSAVEVYESSHNTIHHNTISGSSGFELGGRSTVGNVIVSNQLVSFEPASEALVTRGGADQFGPVLGTVFANNSIYYSGARSKGVICYGGCSAGVLTARNNIVVSPGTVIWADGPMVEDHNVFWGGGNVSLRKAFGVGTKVADPRLINPSKADLRIASNGAAYRRGVAVAVPNNVPQPGALTGPKPSIGVHQP